MLALMSRFVGTEEFRELCFHFGIELEEDVSHLAPTYCFDTINHNH
jgi:hypothetical protein